jgi:hypothetical protein
MKRKKIAKRGILMRKTYGIILASVLLLAPYAVAAPDCKTWLPLLPETFDGLLRLGQPRVDSVEDGSCQVIQLYLNIKDFRGATITIAQGEHSEIMASYEIMVALAGKASTVTWETISGQKTVAYLGKEDKKCSLYFSPRKDVLLILDADSITSKDEMLRLGKLLPLAKLAETKSNP